MMLQRAPVWVGGRLPARPKAGRTARGIDRLRGRGSAEIRPGASGQRPLAPFPHRVNRVSGRGSVASAALAGAATVEDALKQPKEVVQLYRRPGLGEAEAVTLLHKVQKRLPEVTDIDMELCYNVELAAPLSDQEASTLAWLLRETYQPEMLRAETAMTPDKGAVVEVGPRMNFSTAWSANAGSICKSCGLEKVTRVEVSRRYLLSSASPLAASHLDAFAAMVHDRMTEQVYPEPLPSFKVDKEPEPVFEVDLIGGGRAALEAIDKKMGLAFDERDYSYYIDMFVNGFKRNPTNVELFDIAQSNSEHCRHWFFGGNLYLEDGTKLPKTLFQLVKEPYEINPNNSVVAFKDNSSAIKGFDVSPLLPTAPGQPSKLQVTKRTWDLLLTAETHNFPCAVAPYPGAETGAGGRIRDTHATGKGSIMGAATAGYCVGNMRIDGYTQPWEDTNFQYPDTLASPLQIMIDASNGASDYGNKFGEPLIAGYTRACGMRLPNGERREWIKPIMFSGGVGQIDREHHNKDEGQVGMLVVKIGGPAYRIGMGGGAASSVASGELDAELDFNAVQRGDAEMSQKLWRVVRACVEMGSQNPLVQIHDQGAGGNCNVVKEIIYPLGAEIDIRAVKVGDETMSVLEIWGAEYQENDCLLVKPEDEAKLRAICDRERANMQVIGRIDGSGRVVIKDEQRKEGEPVPVDLDLQKVLGDMPPKDFHFKKFEAPKKELEIDAAVQEALPRVLRLVDVCSKRFLTTKVDRSVTGLVAQQQCVGPLQLPLADYALMAQTHQDKTGLVTSIGEQPMKGLVDPAAMARLALAEALTNMCFAKITQLQDVRASVNWMHAAKMDSEGMQMYMTAEALRDAMVEMGVACDGGKDSLSMAASAGGETVKAPGQLVVSAYAPCPDITKKVTPDIKKAGSALVHVDLGDGRKRLGGSALAHVYNQAGAEVPDVEISKLKAAFNTIQDLVNRGEVLSGHDISDGGLVVAALEMAFAGDCGLTVDVPSPSNDADAKMGALAALFAEEVGLLLEVEESRASGVVSAFKGAGVGASVVGTTSADKQVKVSVDGNACIEQSMLDLRATWEETAFQLERLQCAEACVDAEEAVQKSRTAPKWELSYKPAFTPPEKLTDASKYKVAILREEGSNGDREMAAVVHAAGMEPWDVTMSDLDAGAVDLGDFRGIIFVGGFSYADVLDSAKGWASGIRFNARIQEQFRSFYARSDTFSLGICNGCQLMALLGWVPGAGGDVLGDDVQPRFIHNTSGRFESRWSQVTVLDSPAVMLKDMAGSTMGIWVAHGEGKAHFPDAAVKDDILAGQQAPVRYVDAAGSITEAYPFCPNGSPEGIAALCSKDGRHLAMMPHPERCFQGWQLPWAPEGYDKDGPGPWLKLFQNARAFLESTD
ncbi:unnamed protein product [Pedinophyceae sp. YPF-701]|nr:unnamed protein product [Pedinophyceae sp. YPF-701]